MDWTTIRVLTNNLGELLAQHERGEHVEMGRGDFDQEVEVVKDEWWVRARSLTALLAEALGVGTSDLPHLDREEQPAWRRKKLDIDFYLRRGGALVAIARKLLADIDAASSAARSGEPAAASP